MSSQITKQSRPSPLFLKGSTIGVYAMNNRLFSLLGLGLLALFALACGGGDSSPADTSSQATVLLAGGKTGDTVVAYDLNGTELSKAVFSSNTVSFKAGTNYSLHLYLKVNGKSGEQVSLFETLVPRSELQEAQTSGNTLAITIDSATTVLCQDMTVAELSGIYTQEVSDLATGSTKPRSKTSHLAVLLSTKYGLTKMSSLKLSSASALSTTLNNKIKLHALLSVVAIRSAENGLLTKTGWETVLAAAKSTTVTDPFAAAEALAATIKTNMATTTKVTTADFDAALTSYFGTGSSVTTALDSVQPASTGTAATTVNKNPVSTVTINSVDVNTTTNKTTIKFTLSDNVGNGVTSVTNTDLRFALAQLIPGSNGNSDQWQSYNSSSKKTIGGADYNRASAERGNSGTLTYVGNNVGNKVGDWTYEMKYGVNNTDTPVAVTYDSSATHRIAMQVTGMTSNPVYDFRPDGAVLTKTRQIVDEADCNKCHDPLRLHGSRYTIDYCVTCHNPASMGASDTNTAATMDMQSMIHKLHMGKNLPSTVAGSDNYSLGGHDYGKIAFPRTTGMQDCTNCHISGTKTPDYANYNTKPTMEACGSCHDTANFSTGAGFKSITTHKTQTDNSQCATCHTPDIIIGYHDTKAKLAYTAGEYIKYNLISAGNTTPGSKPWVILSITNPKLATTDAGYYLNATSDANTWINLRLAYSGGSNGTAGGDWDNYNESYQSTISVATKTAVAVGDNTFKVHFTTAIPADAVGAGIVSTDGRPKYQFSGDSSATSAYEPNEILNFAITGSLKARRTVVENAKCLSCHGHIAFHGGGRVDEVQTCVTCHNPNMADNQHRVDRLTLTSGTGSGNLKLSGGSANVIADGLVGQAMDMKSMIHGIHSASTRTNPYTVYRTRSGTSYEYVFNTDLVHYPGTVKNCLTCHATDTYTFPLSSQLVGSTIFDLTKSYTDFDTASGNKDTKITPAASACYSCHDSTLAKNHMIQNGANFQTTQTEIMSGNANVSESCALCHGPGKASDVKKVHGL
jgi:OmcA/MtrC family decaheme c-type cytochrome